MVLLSDKHPIDLTIGQELPPTFHYAWVILELLQIIERETSPDDIMFTAPNNAELYFLSERTNGFRFFNPTISLIDEEDTAVFLEDFARVGPALIVHDTRSHYNTDATADLIDRITEDFEVVATVDHYTVFTRR